MRRNRTTEPTELATSRLRLRIPAVAVLAWLVIVLVSTVKAYALHRLHWTPSLIALAVIAVNLVGLYALLALKVADQWEKAVTLRLGRLHGLRGPGYFWIIPVIDRVAAWIDHRVMLRPSAPRKRSPRIPSRLTWTQSSSGWSGMARKPLWNWPTTGPPSAGQPRPRYAR